MNLLDHITLEPDKRGGKPCMRGLRITVHDVLEYLAAGMTEAEVLARLCLRPTRLASKLRSHSRDRVRVRDAAPLCGRGRRVVDCATVSVA